MKKKQAELTYKVEKRAIIVREHLKAKRIPTCALSSKSKFSV